MKKKLITLILLSTLLVQANTLTVSFAATEEEIEASIELGITHLALTQNTDGSWGSYYKIAKTGLAILKFIDYVKEIPDIDSWSNPEYIYHDVVVDGLNYLFINGYYVDISVQPYGDPDTLDNDKGITFNGFDDYEVSVALMALGATMTPGLTVTATGPLNGVTYADVVQDIVDYLSYTQRESTYARGGWGYEGYADWGDNSVSGYAALGLGYAQAFGAMIPQFVKDELTHWISIIQSPSGYSYYRPPAVWPDPYGDLLLRTGNLLYEMALVGMPLEDTNVQAALTYIENNWALGGNYYQRAYCLMKGLEAYGITNEINVGVSGDWFDEISTFIVSTQNTDGSWPSDPHDGDYPYPMTTAWALLTLEKAVAVPQLKASIDIKPGSWPNPINKDKKGVISVAICGTEDFDAATIDPVSVAVHIEGVETGVSPLRWSLEDAATPYDDTTPDDPDGHELTSDGYVDLVFKFDVPELVGTLGLCDIDDWEYIKLYIKGNLLEEEGGTPIEGFDWVRIQSSKGKD